ncbi:MAG: hypothetical protein ABSF23_08990 [Terracidiphilus sp.]
MTSKLETCLHRMEKISEVMREIILRRKEKNPDTNYEAVEGKIDALDAMLMDIAAMLDKPDEPVM